MDWYKTAAAFGTDPFGSSELTDKIRKSPWGFSGGDTYSGLLEPSSGEHHPNDYFSESKDEIMEKKLEEKNKKEKKEKNKKEKKYKKIKRKIKNKKSNKYWYLKEAQWGSGGPSLPILDKPPSGSSNGKDWVSETFHETYEQIHNNKNQSKNDINKYVDLTITVYSYDNDEVEVGSGFFINSNTILTCAHVVTPGGSVENNNTNIEIRYNKKSYNAFLYAYDYNNDLAALVINEKELKLNNSFKFADINKINIGDKILTIGSPLGFEDVVLKGEIASNKVEYAPGQSNKQYIFISTNISQGNSGGPVLLEDTGEVIGIAAAVISLKDSAGGGLNAVIPIDVAQNFLINNGINFQSSFK